MRLYVNVVIKLIGATFAFALFSLYYNALDSKETTPNRKYYDAPGGNAGITANGLAHVWNISLHSVPLSSSHISCHDVAPDAPVTEGSHQRKSPYICPPELHFSSGLPVTALYSEPGSGNTWVRHLIQTATGIYTGSVYFDESLYDGGFLGEGRTNDTVIVVKTHEVGVGNFAKFQRAVMIIREPGAAILAELNWRAKGHTGHAAFDGNGSWLRQTVPGLIHKWYTRNMAWLQGFPGPLHVMFYINLKNNLRHELIDLLRFLKRRISAEQLDCTMKYSEGHFHRNRTGDAFSDIYTHEERTNMSYYASKLDYTVNHKLHNSNL